MLRIVNGEYQTKSGRGDRAGDGAVSHPRDGGRSCLSGKSYVFNYGVASIATRQPVADGTLFEIGSVSKTFTAALASYAQVMGRLSLSDTTYKYLPELRGHPLGDVTLINLGTHTREDFRYNFPVVSLTMSNYLSISRIGSPFMPRAHIGPIRIPGSVCLVLSRPKL